MRLIPNAIARPAPVAALGTALILTVGATSLVAQPATLSALVITTDHRLVEQPLFGASAGITVPLRNRRVAPRFAVEMAFGRSKRIGAPCAGLVQPGTCFPEVVRDATRWLGISGGLAVDLMASPRAVLAIAADAMLTPLTTESTGLQSGRRIRGEQTMLGGAIGLEARWRPRAGSALWIEGAAQYGASSPLRPDDAADGYGPFDDGMTLTRLRLGLAWRPVK